MQLIIKYYYGDYDAIQGGPPTPQGGDKKGQPDEFQKAKPKTTGSVNAASTTPPLGGGGAEWPLWEIFVRSKQGLDHKHVGSLHAADAQMAVENARDVYTRRQEGVSIWVVESKYIHASNPDEAESFYEPASDKIYRHPTFYDLPDGVGHM